MREFRKFLLIAGFGLLVCATGASADSVNLVQNPGFEGGYTAWNMSVLDIAYGGPGGDWPQAHSGYDYDALPSSGYIEQSLPTLTGATYELTFWEADEYNGSNMTLSFGSDQLYTGSSPGGGGNGSTLNWHEFTYSDLVADSDATELKIAGVGIALDDFSVVETAPPPANVAPEPASSLHIVLFLPVVAALERFRKSSFCRN